MFQYNVSNNLPMREKDMKFTYSKLAAALVVGSLLSATTLADGLFHNETHFSYSFIEGNLAHYNQEHLNGTGVSGSFAILPNLSVIGSLQHNQGKKKGFDKPNVRRTATVGAAYHRQLNGTSLANTDFVLHAEMEHKYVSYKGKHQWNTASTEDVGFLLGGGLRSELISNLEVYGDLSLRIQEITTHATSLTEMRVNPIVTVGARYAVIKNLQVGGYVKVVTGDAASSRRVDWSEKDSVAATVRYSF